MKNILVSFVFFALLLLLPLEVFAMDKGPGQAPLPVGGECRYSTVRGSQGNRHDCEHRRVTVFTMAIQSGSFRGFSRCRT
ncbi:MAG: hypothetical protein B5M55_07985 [Desulfococcus sp. 4484_242]|nr:MAG: hypothetical protein B5M55_07985 [Desulfococcus sp. 4484_242]